MLLRKIAELARWKQPYPAILVDFTIHIYTLVGKKMQRFAVFTLWQLAALRAFLKARIWQHLQTMEERKNISPLGGRNKDYFEAEADRMQMIPVLAEEVVITKQIVETGRVRISKKVVSEDTPVSVPLSQETYDIERIALNKVVETPPPATRQEGDVTIMSVVREVLVVQKHYEIVEEIRITKRKTESTSTQNITLRKEEITIDRRAPEH